MSDDTTKTAAAAAAMLLATETHTAAVAKATANRQQTNLIWERTQAAIAVVTTLAYIAAQLSGNITAEGLANAFFLVIGFYFGRTNHARPSTPLNRVGDGPLA